MKITEEKIRRLTISEVPGIDPIRVMLEDIGPGQGRINIECWGQSWANYWGGMGKETIAQFFATCDEHYLAGKLRGELRHEIFDPEHLKDTLKSEVIKERKAGWISHREARSKFNEIEALNVPETEEQLWSISGDMERLVGNEWWCSIPKKPNPDYLYLCRIINTVRDALREVQP